MEGGTDDLVGLGFWVSSFSLKMASVLSRRNSRWTESPFPRHASKVSEKSTRHARRGDETTSYQKLMKARDRGYIAPGMVESLTAFFAVPKGDDNIWLVYDGSVSGLNLSIWVPWFFLPTLRTHLRAVDGDTYMADVGWRRG